MATKVNMQGGLLATCRNSRSKGFKACWSECPSFVEMRVAPKKPDFNAGTLATLGRPKQACLNSKEQFPTSLSNCDANITSNNSVLVAYRHDIFTASVASASMATGDAGDAGDGGDGGDVIAAVAGVQASEPCNEMRGVPCRSSKK